MATTLPCFRSTGIRASASSGHRKPDSNRRKPSSSNWLTPIFGWSSDPDYIDNTDNVSADKRPDVSEAESDAARSRSRFALGCFTEDKAKQLRMKTMESATFHDIMYHSAIASRLASDVSGKYGQ
ncbi:hypothetical protein L1049_001814 [Liquidambar formosana]|uniref:Uncharacterized protein n=1 Tax=Liquidambar formosana TaxID=63359 RepID=A0AAP0QYM6_LIQFO